MAASHDRPVLQVQVSRRDGCAVVSVSGTLRTATLPQLYDALRRGSARADGVVVDLSGVREVSRAAFAALGRATRDWLGAGTRLVVAGLDPDATDGDTDLLAELAACPDVGTAVRQVRGADTGGRRGSRWWALGFRHGRAGDLSAGGRREHRRDAGRQRAGTTPEP